jgi:Winged helix-turn-helix DNA-binding
MLRLVCHSGERVQHPRFSASETAPLVELFEAGLTQKDIAERLRRSPTAVWYCLRRAGSVSGPEPERWAVSQAPANRSIPRASDQQI